MKVLIKILGVSLIVCALLYLFSEVALADFENENNKTLSFLTVGFDDSPSNTDVLGVATYDGMQNTIRLIQIPRDTAIEIDGDTAKLNSFYSRKISEGKTHAQALEELKVLVSDLLGVKIEGYIALTTQGFCDFIDFLGGVRINTASLPKTLVSEMKLTEGENIINGSDALNLVRYRKNYVRGDLERLDTQKVFLKSLALSVKERKGKLSLLRFIQENNGISFSFNKKRTASFALENIFRLGDADIQIATLPGYAEKNQNVWYYVIEKERASLLVAGYFSSSYVEFDSKNMFIYNF